MKVTKSVTKIKNQHCNLLIYNADFDINVAPTGMIWADTTAANNLKTSVQQQIEAYEKNNQYLDRKIAKAESKNNYNRARRLSNRQLNNNNAIGELNTIKGQIDEMGANQNYTFEFKQTNDDYGYVSRAANGNIAINSPSTELKLHETRHAYQYMTDGGNNWRWDSQNRLSPALNYNGMVNWALSEVSAYRLQYAYRSSSMPNSSIGAPASIFDVNYQWVGGINLTYQQFLPFMKQYEVIKRKEYENYMFNFYMRIL